MRKPLIAGNWKMHTTLVEARELVGEIVEGIGELDAKDGVDVLICTPYTLLFPIAKAVANTSVMFGAQNVHEDPQGAFTGEVSVAMLADTGCTFARRIRSNQPSPRFDCVIARRRGLGRARLVWQ